MTFTEPTSEPPEYSDRAMELLYKLYSEINVLLGGSNLELPLEREDYDVAFSRALNIYRQYSSRSVESRWLILERKAGERFYPFPTEIDAVISLRPSMYGTAGTGLSGSSANDSLVLDSAILSGLLGGGGGATSNAYGGGGGGLTSYYLYHQQLETFTKLFARSAISFRYRYNPEGGNVLELLDNGTKDEYVLVECSVLRPVEELLVDHFSREIILKLTMIEAQIIVSRAFMTGLIPAPQSPLAPTWIDWGTSGPIEREKIIDEILSNDDSSTGYAQLIFG